MSKYIELLLKAMIVFMFGISIMRIYYIWVISKTDDRESNIMFRNQEGDWTIVLFILLIMNKSRFDQYKFAFQPFLRNFYAIIVILFIVYTILQLTQLIVLTKDSLMTQEVVVNKSDLVGYAVGRRFYGYKFTIIYMKKEKKKKLLFFTTKKNKEVIEKRFKEYNVNIV